MTINEQNDDLAEDDFDLDLDLEAPTARPAAPTAKAVKMKRKCPKNFLQFLRYIAAFKCRMTYGMMKTLGVRFEFIKPGQRLQGMGDRVSDYIPNDLMHFICRKNSNPEDGGYWSLNATPLFKDGWQEEVDMSKAPINDPSEYDAWKAKREEAGRPVIED